MNDGVYKVIRKFARQNDIDNLHLGMWAAVEDGEIIAYCNTKSEAREEVPHMTGSLGSNLGFGSGRIDDGEDYEENDDDNWIGGLSDSDSNWSKDW